MRKGQHLALESVATFGLTLIAAVGVVQMFGNVNKGVVTSTQETQAEVVSDRLRSVILQMQSSSDEKRAYHQVELPDQIGGQDYRVALEKGKILVFTENQNYQQNFNVGGPSISQSGAVEGGSVRVFKNSEGFVLRPGR